MSNTVLWTANKHFIILLSEYTIYIVHYSSTVLKERNGNILFVKSSLLNCILVVVHILTET